jgi:hypothetical protein
VRRHALEDEPLGFLAALVEHPVAHEAVADADEHGHLADALAHGHRGRDSGGRRAGAAHVVEEPHHVGGAEEVRADHRLGPAGGGGDLVHVERRGIGGEHRVGLREAVELGEDLLFDGHLLEHRLDDDVSRAGVPAGTSGIWATSRSATKM